ncbi:MAG TPA: ABC transporter substrate-binding protein [Micromonosporaceae bacterium]|jgi:4,5-dihydroxyphthalate decarboxylase
MAELALRTVTRPQGLNRALIDGSVTPAPYRFEFVDVPVLINGFRRMVRGLEFDVCEMALTTYVTAKAHGVAFTALPIFPVRGFHLSAVQVNTHAGIKVPTDLEGRRVGVNRGYTVTTGVWARGALRKRYGVDLDAVTWVLSGDEHVQAYRPPANVIPMPDGGDLAAMLIDGAIDAAIGLGVDHPDVVPLVPNASDLELSDLRDGRGIFPINHCIVVRDDLLAAHPDIGPAVARAFGEAKAGYLRSLQEGAVTPADTLHRAVLTATGTDPLPYGIEPNRKVLDELLTHAVDQHILTHRPALEELFAVDAGTE